ncbi:hypothetical protein CFAM422_010195 [Trichoderma lentiforme]|uniref:Uncharacterized protein n=1 Tax=Trichoderma lentiforme TaxID=1567552 RepID=A0A9P4X8V5_9HYPO|nr:hypothetical protein CFAM422_010195 [Trichoderma lentiforme]
MNNRQSKSSVHVVLDKEVLKPFNMTVTICNNETGMRVLDSRKTLEVVMGIWSEDGSHGDKEEKQRKYRI